MFCSTLLLRRIAEEMKFKFTIIIFLLNITFLIEIWIEMNSKWKFYFVLKIFKMPRATAPCSSWISFFRRKYVYSSRLQTNVKQRIFNFLLFLNFFLKEKNCFRPPPPFTVWCVRKFNLFFSGIATDSSEKKEEEFDISQVNSVLTDNFLRKNWIFLWRGSISFLTFSTRKNGSAVCRLQIEMSGGKVW